MKLIPLTNGNFAKVDDEDYDFLMRWKWQAKVHKAVHKLNIYAARSERVSVGVRKEIKMHRLIMNNPEGKFIDHIDHDGLNNQKNNLRLCDKKENAQNKTGIGSSKYLGVSIRKYNQIKSGKTVITWRAMIRPNKTLLRIGEFKIEEDAARAYDEAAKKYFGEFASLNFK